MLACDLESNNSWGVPGHGLCLVSVPLASLKHCNVEDMPCRRPSCEKEAAVNVGQAMSSPSTQELWPGLTEILVLPPCLVPSPM